MVQTTDEDFDTPPRLTDEEIEAIVKKIVQLHSRKSGSTVNRNAESLVGKRFFAVSIFPERSKTVAARVLPEQIVRAFVKNNADLLGFKFSAVGTWVENENESWLDVSVLVASESRAIELGNDFNQLAIYDLHRERAISLAGDGTLPDEKRLLSDLERLRIAAAAFEEQKNGD